MHRHRISGTISLKGTSISVEVEHGVTLLPITMDEDAFEDEVHKAFDFVLVPFELQQIRMDV
jgi:hypothetical protein